MTHDGLTYQLWKHASSGDVWAVQLDGNKLVGTCGPLHHDEYNGPDILENCEYTDEDVEWFEQRIDDFRLYEPK